MKTRRIRVAAIRRDGGTQPRVEIDAFVVDEYSAAMRRGDKFPPVTVFDDGSALWLTDGFHRTAAAEQAGRTRIVAEVVAGSRDDAVWHALAANKKHGLRRTNADKRRAVLIALDHERSHALSTTLLGEHCGVSDEFVRRLRQETGGGSNDWNLPARTVGKDGKFYPASRPGPTERIAPAVREMLRALTAEMPRSDLVTLAELPAHAQLKIARRLMAGKSASVRDAARQLRCAEPARQVAAPDANGEPFFSDDSVRLYCGDALPTLRALADRSVHCVVTSPPYFGLRDYRVAGQVGLEATPEQYIGKLVEVFSEARRVLCDDGTLWLNLGDSYAGSGKGPTGHNGIGDQKKRQGFDSVSPVIPDGLKPKDLIGIPWRVALALQADGWYLRSDIIWSKSNPMPESVVDRPTRAHEYVFLLTKSAHYYYDAGAVREQIAPSSARRVALARSRIDPSVGVRGHKAGAGRTESRGHHANHLPGVPHPLGPNRRDVWTIPVEPSGTAHFAAFPRKLVGLCVRAGCPAKGTVLDPFCGSGTALVVARGMGRRAVGVDISPAYCRLAAQRLGTSKYATRLLGRQGTTSCRPP